MSVALCMSLVQHPTPFPSEKGAIALLSDPNWSDPNQTAVQEDQDRPTQLDMWGSIQSPKAAVDLPPPYVHPLVRRSSSLLSQKSLEVCTESLGSETGSDEFSGADYYPPVSEPEETDEKAPPLGVQPREEVVVMKVASMELEVRQAVGNYHCAVGRRSPPRSFPPPLPSLSRRDKPCLRMRPRRRDGRLVVEAIPVPSHNFLHARRSPGRLLLSFIDAPKQEEEEEEEMAEKGECFYEEEEEEEEVEVVDRGAVVEVKISTQPQQQGSAASKVHRSAFVINKFVGGEPRSGADDDHAAKALASAPPRRALSATTTTTAAAAVVAASTLSASSPSSAEGPPAVAESENKLLFTSKGRSKEELLRYMRRCSQLRRPLFIWEPYCIATSS